MKPNKLRLAVAVIVVLAVCAVLAVETFAVTAITENAIVSATVSSSGTQCEVKAEFTDEFVAANKGATLYLFSIPPYGSASRLAEYTPAGEAKVDSKVTFKPSCDVKSDPSILYTKFLVATEGANGYEIVTSAHYIDNPDIDAANTYAFPLPQSQGKPLKKGLTTASVLGDAAELGASHVMLEVALNEIMCPEAGDTYSYEWAGSTWYVHRSAVDQLDLKTRLLTDSGINVYFKYVLKRSDSQSAALDVLYYPDAVQANYYALNVGNERAVLWVEGLTRFLTERYTDPERPHGFCGSYIWGHNVNSNRNFYSMGPMSMDNFLNYYIAAYRIIDTSVRSVYTEGRTYISLDNNYNVLSSDFTREADSQYDYDALTFLGKFADKVKYAGDIPWRLAITGSPSNRASSRLWDDANATGDSTTPFITMKNIDVLTLLMAGDQYLYNGQQRSILIDEFEIAGYSAGNGEGDGIVAAGNQADTTPEQAASYAYAYYQAAFNDRIEAIIYTKHVDTQNERRGLWTSTVDETTGDIRPYEKKQIYNVFKYIDTGRSEEMTASCLSVIGVTSWGDLIRKYNKDALTTRDITETIPQLTSDLTRQLDSKVLYDFTEGDYNSFFWSYLAAGSDTNITLDDDPDSRGGTILHANMTTKYPSEYMGIGVTKIRDEKGYTKEELAKHSIPLSGVKYISFDIKVTAPSDVSKIAVMLWTEGKGSADENASYYEGVAQIDPGEWTTVTFKMDTLTDSHPGADSLKIMIRPYDEQHHDGTYSMYLKQVLTWQKPANKILGVLKAVGIVLLVLIIIAVILLAALIIRRQIIVRRMKAEKARRLSEQNAARRQAARRPNQFAAPQYGYTNNQQPIQNQNQGQYGQPMTQSQQFAAQQQQQYAQPVYNEFNDAGSTTTGSTPAVRQQTSEQPRVPTGNTTGGIPAVGTEDPKSSTREFTVSK